MRTLRQLLSLGLRQELIPVEVEPEVVTGKPVLHGVGVGGRPLCGFVDALPIFWPMGHKYVNPEFQLDEITCSGCLARAIERFSQRAS